MVTSYPDLIATVPFPNLPGSISDTLNAVGQHCISFRVLSVAANVLSWTEVDMSPFPIGSV